MKLSIIVPIYNVAPYLRKCVDSLLAQDYTDYEIILVDDGSTDGSSDIADKICEEVRGEEHPKTPRAFSGTPPRLEVKGNEYSKAESQTLSPHRLIASSPTIRVIHQSNAGLSAARNAGLAIAQGEYIMYVDSDDYLQPNVLGALMEQVERDQLDVLRFRYQNVRESGEVFAPYKDMTNYNDYSSAPTDGLTFLNERMGTQCYAVQFIIRRELALLEQFTLGIYFEDTDWTPRMLLRAERVASTDKVVYNYLWREGSITLSQKDIAKQRKQLQDKMALLERLNQWGNTVSDRRWFDSMISSLVVNIVGMLAGPFYSERKEYIKRIKSLGILPITTDRIAPRAKRKVTLINWSIALATDILHLRNKI